MDLQNNDIKDLMIEYNVTEPNAFRESVFDKFDKLPLEEQLSPSRTISSFREVEQKVQRQY